MDENIIPWKNILEFHRDISIRSEESFFTFPLKDSGSEKFSFVKNGIIKKLEINETISLDSFTNEIIFNNINQENTEFYIGGIFWYAQKNIDEKFIKMAHPLLFKSFNVTKSQNKSIEIQPQQAKWDISPLFYKLLDKKGIVLDEDIDDVMNGLIENTYQMSNENDFESNFVKNLVEKYPELKDEFIKNKNKTSDNNWLIFVAPKEFSVIQRNLILDYSKLIEKIEDDGDNIGGLKLFNNSPVSEKKRVEVMPIVPLNDNQLKVVEKVISGNEATVVSGPPGCGKSQVVISIMLNAWKNNQSVLFASSNNQAVNVVRDRLKKYEKKIPLVVRAGSKRSSELRYTLSRMMSILNNFKEEDNIITNNKKIQKLQSNYQDISKLLDSNLPQRIDEFLRYAFSEYARSIEYQNEYNKVYDFYNSELNKIGILESIDCFGDNVYIPYKNWIKSYSTMIKKIEQNIDYIRNLNNEKDECYTQINELLNPFYTVIPDKNVFLEETINKVKLWLDNYRDFILLISEDDIQKDNWKTDYNYWKSSDDVNSWIKNCETYINLYKTFIKKNEQNIVEIVEKNKKLEDEISILENENIKEFSKNEIEALEEWKSIYNEYALKPKSIIDSLPFSNKKKLDKKLLEYENIFISNFRDLFSNSNINNPTYRRTYIFNHLKNIENVNEARIELDKLTFNKNKILEDIAKIKDVLEKIGETEIINPFNIKELNTIYSNYIQKSKLAKEAQYAFQKREKKDNIIRENKKLKNHGSQLMYVFLENANENNPIKQFYTIINNSLYKDISEDEIISIQNFLNTHSVEKHIDSLYQVSKKYSRVEEINNLINDVSTEKTIHEEWVEECPIAVYTLFENKDFKEIETTSKDLNSKIDMIYNQWIDNGKDRVIVLKEEEKKSNQIVCENLFKALDLCPENILESSKSEIKSRININDLDISYIRKVFSGINTNGLLAKQIRAKNALEDALLNNSIAERLETLCNDENLKASLNKLDMDYKTHGEVFIEQNIEDYKNTLKALPLWITTGQSPQSIPMEPGIFDILVIDEATQCTITSMLPLIYRCKRIVVIGDMDQLPAIDSISITSERFLSSKYKLDDYLFLLGHCGCNVYKSILNIIPMREGNVINLIEHYRSHPLIIGFSNYYVYKNKLVLKKVMDEVENNKLFGLFGENVSGESYKDPYTDSWCNDSEANRVVEIIQEIKNTKEYYGYSIGVITPFRGQVKLIYEKLEKVENAQDVLVSTVHKYQGDERDIIIFSPVVSKGISAGTATWVETPQNLINVAVTRAKEALYIVSDFEICKRQPGILGKLIQYVEKIEILRKTSPFELQLYGMMVLQGWDIEVHPIIKDIEVDFVISYMGKRLAIEVDGKQHLKQKSMDNNRDALLASKGYDTIRISTREISETPFEVINKIEKSLQKNN